MSTLRLHVKTLVRSMITRARGQEVYEHLESYLHSNSVIEIDLSGEDPLGMSFLDEVIRHLSEAGHLSRIIFLVEKTEVLHKLARIADIRRVDIHYLDMNTLEKKRVEPLPADTTDVITHAIKPTHGAEAITRPLASLPFPQVTIHINPSPWLQTSTSAAAGDQSTETTKYFGHSLPSERLRIEKGQLNVKD